MTFHERIAELRKATGLSQKEFAIQHSIEPSKYNKWENGKSVPDLETIGSLADIFNVTIDYLAGRTNTPSVDLTVQDICNQIGLDEYTVVKLQEAVASTQTTHYPQKEMLEAFDAFFREGEFWNWLIYLHAYIYPNGIARERLEEFQDIVENAYPVEMGVKKATVDDMYVLTNASTYFTSGARKAQEHERKPDGEHNKTNKQNR